MDTRSKIIRLEQARRLVQDGRVATAGGAFDVLQAGHARFLAAMRSPGAGLLVAVWDDATLGRPILPEQARAQLVAALAAVDWVVVCAPGDLAVDRVVPDERNIISMVLERRP
jgi:bifunctional ADP-heptose synthase (sugar kinase/adenylyltransferase)